MCKSFVNFKYPTSRTSMNWTQVHTTNLTGNGLGNEFMKYRHCH